MFRKKINYKKLILALIIPQLAGFLGSIANITAIDTWYTTLNRPELNPPNWIFAPVWTTLFLLMGWALYLVWQKRPWGGINKKVELALFIFYTQLIFNIAWSYLFFYFQSPVFALLDIVVLWVLILLNIIFFLKVDWRAGVLLIPYLLWVSFASYLNYAIFLLN